MTTHNTPEAWNRNVRIFRTHVKYYVSITRVLTPRSRGVTRDTCGKEKLVSVKTNSYNENNCFEKEQEPDPRTTLHQKGERNVQLRRNKLPVGRMPKKRRVIYEATVKTNVESFTYVGLTSDTFKSRYNNHLCSFRNDRYRSSTTLSQKVWDLKDTGVEFKITWRIIKSTSSYQGGGRGKCDLCLSEKEEILKRIKLVDGSIWTTETMILLQEINHTTVSSNIDIIRLKKGCFSVFLNTRPRPPVVDITKGNVDGSIWTTETMLLLQEINHNEVMGKILIIRLKVRQLYLISNL
eukprot:sb/3479700/